MLERKPSLIAQVIADNDYPTEILDALDQYKDEIASQPISPLKPSDDPLLEDNIAFWNSHWQKVEGRYWLDLPWYFAETWFYRRLLQDTQYFECGSAWHLRDPFAPSKRQQEADALSRLGPVWDGIQALPESQRFELLLHSALWGNRADLSNFTVEVDAQPGLDTHQEQENLLIDHTAEIKALVQSGVQHIAFVNDNVGADSLFDLLLADYLLDSGIPLVTMHLKDRPFFVSDAMVPDIVHVIGALTQHANAGLRVVGQRLLKAVDEGTLALTSDSFWTSCLCFDAMPDALRETVSKADLVILKGDVNYRRLLDDRHWPHTTRMEDASDFPRPFVTLRTLKGEIMVGLEAGVAESLAAQEPDWLINGKRGIIQLVTT